MWVAKYPEAGRDTTSDSNGDGTPNFIEMMLDLDPFAEPKPPIPADPRAAEKLEERQAASRRRNRLALAPFLNDGIRDSEGNPATRADLKADALRKSRDLGVRLKREEAERKNRIENYLEGAGDHLSAAEREGLHDVVDGEPRFISSLSHRQAFETGVLQLWPGGYANLDDITGEGATVAMWDKGGVAAAHEQFGATRVVNVDNPGPPDEHATAVATVIIGAGDPADTDLTDFGINVPYPFPNTPTNNARGMAYRANLRVYDIPGDLGEMGDLAEEAMDGASDIVFSNHAYGIDCAYQRFQSTNPTAPWTWHGDPALGDGTVDYKHGFYLSDRSRAIDEIVHTNKVFLPIWSAGNEAANFDLADSPEPEESGKPFPVAHKVMLTGATYTAQNAPARKQDASIHTFTTLGTNNLLPEACSKNVLTVGDLSEVSSEGPTDDLRHKPDIVSGGLGGDLSQSALHSGITSYREFEGSSFAAASVTGGLALVRQRWQQLNGTSNPVLASTWKGLAIATAGGELFHYNGAFISGGSAPTPEAGYGPFDPLDAVYIIGEDFAARSADTGARIMEIMLKEGDDARFKVRRINLQDSFRVAICWTDPPGSALTKSLNPRDPVLINDVDLRVIRADESELKPWALRTQSDDPQNFGYRIIKDKETGDNTRDNVEVVDVSGIFLEPESEFTVKITRKPNQINSDPQLVSIVIVGDAEAVLPPFRIVNFAQTDENDPDIYGVTWLSIPGAIYRIESSSDLDSWQALPNEISAIGDKITTELDMVGMGDRKFIRVRRLD